MESRPLGNVIPWHIKDIETVPLDSHKKEAGYINLVGASSSSSITSPRVKNGKVCGISLPWLCWCNSDYGTATRRWSLRSWIFIHCTVPSSEGYRPRTLTQRLEVDPIVSSASTSGRTVHWPRPGSSKTCSQEAWLGSRRIRGNQCPTDLKLAEAEMPPLNYASFLSARF